MSEYAGNHQQDSFWSRYVFSTDHKIIGLQYLSTGLLMAVLGGALSYLFRMQLAFPGRGVAGFEPLTPQNYNICVTMHGTIMIFWVAMPVLLAAFGNLLIPTMIGAPDMAFPKLNMASFWIFFLSTILLILSFFVPGGAFAGGWTAYPPLSANGYKGIDFATSLGGDLWILAVALEFVAFLMGGINFLTTTLNMRAKGLTFFRLPMVIWMINIATVIFMFSVGPLVAGAVMLLLDRTVGTGFYNPAAGGDPILFQHLFWFFGHPEVYVLLLPSLGFLAEIMPAFSRKPLFGYRMIVYSTIIAGFLSFIVWAHHQFVAGIDPRMSAFFSITTIMISVPFAIIIFSLMATIWGGSIEFSLPMLFSLGTLAEFLIGGVTGIYLGASAFDIYAHDTYFVVAHFHYTLIPVVIFGGSAAIYFWYPKFIGRKLNNALGQIHFWGTSIFFNSLFIPLFFTGMAGQHRRIFSYAAFSSALNNPHLSHLQVVATISMILVAAFQAVFLINLIWSVFYGEVAGDNPWKAATLEWTIPSPPPHGNFETTPVVCRGPYEYSAPDAGESDFCPQNDIRKDASH
ncbi:cbb3-type cytochrome c oxidase subunit I [bacterium]|nr:cbb3-type cytochrome c oxidase subunit I [bacterium]